jgi:aminoglycoside N3'-acetyltransferase
LDKAQKQKYCERLERAVEQGFENLGNQGKEALLLHLRQSYNIRLGGTNCSSLEDIERAVNDVFGQAGAIIMHFIRERFESSSGGDDDDSNRTV